MQEEVCEGLKRQPTVYEAVQANVQKQQDKVRKRKLEQGWDDQFEVGDVVLKKNIREEQRKGGKMAPEMLGPFTITEIKGKVVCLVGNKQQKHIANLDQLTRYIEPEERIPAKLLKLAGTFPLARPPPPLSPLSHPPAPHPPQLSPSPSSPLPGLDPGPAQPSFSPSGPPPAVHHPPSPGPSTPSPALRHPP